MAKRDTSLRGEVFQEEYEPEKGRIFSSRLPRVDVVVNSGTPPSSRQLVNECLLFPIELNQFSLLTERVLVERNISLRRAGYS